MSVFVAVDVGVVGMSVFFDDGVEPVVFVCVVLDCPDRTVRVVYRVAAFHVVLVTVFPLALHVPRVRVVHFVIEFVMSRRLQKKAKAECRCCFIWKGFPRPFPHSSSE